MAADQGVMVVVEDTHVDKLFNKLHKKLFCIRTTSSVCGLRVIGTRVEPF